MAAPELHANTGAHAWLNTLIQQSRSARLNHLDIVINASRMDYSLPERLQALPVPPQLVRLLDQTPEAAIAHRGPMLVRVDLSNHEQRAWLVECVAQLYHQHRLLAINSSWSFDNLAAHLRHSTQAEWNKGKSTGLLRYYDTRLFLATCETLDAGQSKWFHAPVITWHWIDRDGKPAQYDGNATPEYDSALPLLRLSNVQVAALMAWTMAEMLRSDYGLQPEQYAQINREGLMRHLTHAQLAADRAGHFDESRDAFVFDWLDEHSATAPPRTTFST